MTTDQKKRFSELKIKMFAAREKISKIIEGGAKFVTSGRETVTVEEIKEFLHLAALSHKAFFQYTRLSSLQGILKTRHLYLSRLSEMNDLDEYENTTDADRIFITSMSYGGMENMALWRTYGGCGGGAVRMAFDARETVRALNTMHRIFDVKEGQYGPTGEIGSEIGQGEIADWSFHDVAYKYGQALFWNHQVVGKGRCLALNNVWNAKLDGYVKNFGWASENEVRLVVKLKKAKPERKHIAVDFNDVIEKMRIVTGPEYCGHDRVVDTVRSCGCGEMIKVEASRYKVRFRKDS